MEVGGLVLHQCTLWNYILMIVYCLGEMTWWLRELAALSEDLVSDHTYLHASGNICTHKLKKRCYLTHIKNKYDFYV